MRSLATRRRLGLGVGGARAGPGLLCRASVFLRTRSVGQTLGRCGSPRGGVAWGRGCRGERLRVAGRLQETGFQMEPHLGRGGRPLPRPQRCGAGGRNPARAAHAPVLPNCREKLPVGLWYKVGASSLFLVNLAVEWGISWDLRLVH